jgi:glutathione synthase/RimK-type ligase-like ATP-grasp enzyme
MVVLLCGIPSETPLALVRHELAASGITWIEFNQRLFTKAELSYEVDAGEIRGSLRLGSAEFDVSEISGVYVRLMDDRLLPELASEPDGSPLRRHCRQLHDALTAWFEIAQGRVVNRYSAMGSNGSKPYQAQLILEHGFRTPETLVTNDPDAVVAFRREYGRVIYKSLSGLRSIVSELTDDDLSRLDRVRSCPTQFQEYIDGQNVRLHVVGTHVFATTVTADGIDYRYAHQAGANAPELAAADVPDRIATQAVALTADLGLAFAGIDLIIGSDGYAYCLEVNPSPAFSYYEQHTGQPIAKAVAQYLAGSGQALV